MNLKPGAHIHLMGICGTAMGGLAGLLKDLGYKVTGSDQNVYPPMSTEIEKLGIKIQVGFKKENLTPRPDLVIVGNVMTRKHEEVEALLATDIPYTHLPDAIGRFVIGDRNSIVLAGTHGKTTTTAMMAFVADKLGVKPGFLIGGKPLDFDTSFRLPQGDFFVIEGDEYDTAFFAKVPKFIFYKPKYVVLTSVEFDHADIYKNFDEVKKAFISLMELIPKDGFVVAFTDDPGVREVIPSCKNGRTITYGFETGDYRATNLTMNSEFAIFDIEHKGKKIDKIEIRIFGKHNIANALATYAICRELKWNSEKTKEALKGFRGVKRRQEVIGKPKGVTIIEDFAHHPTAVKLTAGSIKERFQNSNMFTVFEPRSATTRRKVFQKEYVDAFAGKWTSVFAPPFNQTNIPENDRFSSDELVRDLKERGVEAVVKPTTDEIVSFLASRVRPGDVILVMSNGGFDGIYQKLISSIEAKL